MTIKLRTIALALALAINYLFPARAARAGNSPGPTSHDAAFSYAAQASRASKRFRHKRAARKSARCHRRPSPASQPSERTDIQPALRDDAEGTGTTPRPTPTPSLEQQFPKTYKIKKP